VNGIGFTRIIEKQNKILMGNIYKFRFSNK